MNRYTIAVMLTAAFAGLASAQTPRLDPPKVLPPPPNPLTGSQFLPIGPPPMMPSLNAPALPIPAPHPGPPITTPGIGFYKSGGAFIGENGYFPYDSGNWLVGGVDGFARSVGTFTMVPGSGAGAWGSGSAAPACHSHGCRLFRR